MYAYCYITTSWHVRSNILNIAIDIAYILRVENHVKSGLER